MDEKLFEKIKKAAENSILNPGQTFDVLPVTESDKFPKIIVFRHGESFDNKNKVFSGWRDSELTDVGIKQAEELAENLKKSKINLCIISPLSRSKQTAKIALKHHLGVLFEEDSRIIERNYGELTGKSKEELMKQNPEIAVKYRRGYDFPPPRGESIEMVERRIIPFCEDLVERVKKNNINVAISAHGNSMRVIRKFFENLTIEAMLTQENPLAGTFAQYVIQRDPAIRSEKSIDNKYLNGLFFPDNKIKDRMLS